MSNSNNNNYSAWKKSDKVLMVSLGYVALNVSTQVDLVFSGKGNQSVPTENSDTPRPDFIPETFTNSLSEVEDLAPDFPFKIPHEHVKYIIYLEASSKDAKNGFYYQGDING